MHSAIFHIAPIPGPSLDEAIAKGITSQWKLTQETPFTAEQATTYHNNVVKLLGDSYRGRTRLVVLS